MLDWFRKIFGSQKPQAKPLNGGFVRGRYDAANSASQSEHWALADLLGPNAANSPSVRQVLRSRARLELANNSYARGAADTYANEIVGRGARLQMLSADDGLNSLMESHWRDWDEATNFSEKLHSLVLAKFGDGEGTAKVITNPKVRHPVQLDIRPIEPEMLTTPETSLKPGTVDGIVFDSYGNPVEYHVLKQHPNDGLYPSKFGEYEKVPEKYFLHWFSVLRPGQARGIPDITPCLGLFAQLRRWTLAVLASAELAASISAILKTPVPGEGQDPAVEWESIPYKIGTLLTTPGGYDISQFKAEQPVATYESFKEQLLKEIGRAIGMPFHLIAGDSSSYSYASVRMDAQGWNRRILVDRASLRRWVIEKIFALWVEEAAKTIAELSGITLSQVPHKWFFDPTPHVDPVKEATGDSLDLANILDTAANKCAERGEDWEEVYAQRGREVKRAKELGLEMYLPDFTMLIQKEIAEQNGPDAKPAKSKSKPPQDD